MSYFTKETSRQLKNDPMFKPFFEDKKKQAKRTLESILRFESNFVLRRVMLTPYRVYYK